MCSIRFIVFFVFPSASPARLLGRPPCAPYGHPTPNMRHSVEPLSPAPDDTLESLRERAVLLSATAVADQVARLAHGEATELPGTSDMAPQYFALHPRLSDLAAARLAARTD